MFERVYSFTELIGSPTCISAFLCQFSNTLSLAPQQIHVSGKLMNSVNHLTATERKKQSIA